MNVAHPPVADPSGRLLRAPVLIVLFPLLLAVTLATGCTSGPLFQKKEKVEEGPMAARREAEAEVLARSRAGETGSGGTTSSVPSLAPGEGRVLLPAADAPPPTAPPEDEFDDDNAGHLLARCRDRSARQQWFDAVGDCRRSYELNPDSIEPQEELMRLLVTLQAYADAEKAARKVLDAKPGDPVALYYLAWSYRGRDLYPDAIAILEQVVAASPDRVEFVQALGMTYCLAENYGTCITTLERALAMRPGDPRTEAMIREARAQAAEKLAPFEKFVREEPASYDNRAALGFMYQKYGFPQEALTAYDSALARMPSPLPEQDSDMRTIAAQVYYNRGVVYRELGRPDLGEPALWQSMQLDSALASVAWYNIGLCRYDAGKFDPSIEALRKSVDLAPGVAENRTALARAYDKAGRKSEATEQRNAVKAIEARAAADKAAIARQEAAGGLTDEEVAAAAAAASPKEPGNAAEVGGAASATSAPPATPDPAAQP